jgi:deoxyribose-phosphate aldolase
MTLQAQARRLLTLLDLTLLDPQADATAVLQLCDRAVTAAGPVAAVCIPPAFVRSCRQRLAGTGVKIATVANFPGGDADFTAAVAEVRTAVAAGADEVDLVIPYRRWLAGERPAARALVTAGKAVCGPQRTLKVILETGALPGPAAIAAIAQDAIEAGADFLKTSTGRIEPGATPAAATVLLAAIKQAGRPVGFKAAGGIRTLAAALPYLELADGILGAARVNPATFRIGASALLDELLHVIEGA